MTVKGFTAEDKAGPMQVAPEKEAGRTEVVSLDVGTGRDGSQLPAGAGQTLGPPAGRVGQGSWPAMDDCAPVRDGRGGQGGQLAGGDRG